MIRLVASDSAVQGKRSRGACLDQGRLKTSSIARTEQNLNPQHCLALLRRALPFRAGRGSRRKEGLRLCDLVDRRSLGTSHTNLKPNSLLCRISL